MTVLWQYTSYIAAIIYIEFSANFLSQYRDIISSILSLYNKIFNVSAMLSYYYFLQITGTSSIFNQNLQILACFVYENA